MAGKQFVLNSAAIAIGTSVKTLAHVRAASNVGVLANMINVTFKGIDPTDLPILVQIVRQTADGTATGSTLVKLEDDHPDTIQATGHENFTVEPGTTAVLEQRYVSPTAGYTFAIPRLVDGGEAIGVRINNTGGVDVNAVVSMQCEE